MTLEATNYKVNSDGREVKNFDGHIKGKKIKIKAKVNPEGDILEYVSGVPKQLIGEQLFTYDALCRLGVEKRLPTFEDIKSLEDVNLTGFCSASLKNLHVIGDWSSMWLAGGDNANFNQNGWYLDTNTRDYGFSVRLLEDSDI